MATSTSKKRKIQEENRSFKIEWEIKYFFVEDSGKFICLICRETIASAKKGNFERHYNTKHQSNFVGILGESRRTKLDNLKRNLKSEQSIFSKNDNSVKSITAVSFAISNIIAKRMKPFTDGEFIKECLNEFADQCCPDKKQLIQQFCSLALDGSKDICDVEQLAIWIRGVDENFNITEELLSLRSMHGRTRGIDIFEEFLKIVSENNIPALKLSGISTDGAPSMLSTGTGFKGQVLRWLTENNVTEISWCHCIIHQEALCAKTLGLENVMKLIVDVVNFIRSKGVNHREFKEFLKDLDSDYGDVLYFTSVRWLSRGVVLKRVWELRDEISSFLASKGKKVLEFEDTNWISDFAFLLDMTTHLNILNSTLQGKNKLIHELYATIRSFEMKLALFKLQLKNNNFSHFPALKSQDSADGNKYAEIISNLQENFDTRFGDFRNQQQSFEIFAQPFSFDPQYAPQELQLELIDLQSSIDLKADFKNVGVISFYKTLPSDIYPAILKHARRIASLFGSTYTCEAFFSKMKYIKNKYRTNLTDDHLQDVLRISSTDMKPNIDGILIQQQKQYQPSH
ncbi:General transcription factor II-I repeat domain-containing protein 2-like [Oopsacas minuta]|uniref:General transcription factor II-I repeat domain-containing protein 2-like n=1 Tax=Oopsacas minuta TaxID=111878 RepID=A0AAV7KK79_9METZ|nr:General transcription factor II-I repeat domain-containing protein 2-like [Oopsacas minuta]